MADAKPDAQSADASHNALAERSVNPRVRPILVVALPLLVALGAAAIVFATLGPTSGGPAPGQTPGISPGTSPTPSATIGPSPAPGDDPAVPTDKQPAPLNETAPITPGLTAEITRIEPVDGTARGPGEVAGPSLRVTVTIVNSTSADAPLNTTVVSSYYGADLTPAPELREPGGSPLPASVGAGKTVTGVYIFTVPEGDRRNVTVMVDYSVDVDPLVFQGDVTSLVDS